MNAVLFNNPDMIEAEMRRLVPILKKDGGFVFSSDHSVPDSVSPENFRYITDLAKELGKYYQITNLENKMSKKILFLILILGAVFVVGGCNTQTPQTPQTPQTTVLGAYYNTSLPTPFVKETSTLKPTDKVATSKKIAYITIDDGPSSNNTVKNLDTLKRSGVKATFFVLPRKGVDDVYKRIFDEGHEIANHSYSHDYKSLYSTTKFFEEDLLKARKMIEDKFGYTTKVYRFPGGTMGKSKMMIAERVKILEKYGYKYYNWDVSTGDTDTGPAGKVKLALVNNVLNNTKGRNKLIILMHDDPTKITTTEALPDIIEGLTKMGYTFDVLSNY